MRRGKRLYGMTGVAVVASVVMTLEAAAWGPRAREAITITAVQLERRTLPNAFKSKDANYEADLLRGALAGPGVIREFPEMKTEKGLVNLVGTEIQLLREVRKYGMGSFFCFRMGALGSLTADAFLPYALEPSKEGKELIREMQADIDVHVQDFTFTPVSDSLDYVRNPLDYVKDRRTAFEDATVLIRYDYRGGRRFDGYLDQGAQAFFEQAIQAVGDVWFTALRVTGDVTDVPPSDTAVTWYLVDEIAYLLTVKGSLAAAEDAYANFEDVNPGIFEAFEVVGDSFYHSGAKDRGVREWRNAMTEASGQQRQRLRLKLADHFLVAGKELRQKMNSPDAPQTTLDDALRAFETSYEYNRDNPETEGLINRTRSDITERDKRLAEAMGLVASGEQRMHEAEDSRSRGAYADAIGRFDTAISVFEDVSDEFIEQKDAAANQKIECNRQISAIIAEVLEKAADLIDDGERLLAENDFTGAENKYASVKTVLDGLPDNDQTREDKKDLLDEAIKKSEGITVAKQQYEARIAAEMQRREDADARAATAAQQNN